MVYGSSYAFQSSLSSQHQAQTCSNTGIWNSVRAALKPFSKEVGGCGSLHTHTLYNNRLANNSVCCPPPEVNTVNASQPVWRGKGEGGGITKNPSSNWLQAEKVRGGKVLFVNLPLLIHSFLSGLKGRVLFHCQYWIETNGQNSVTDHCYQPQLVISSAYICSFNF